MPAAEHTSDGKHGLVHKRGSLTLKVNRDWRVPGTGHNLRDLCVAEVGEAKGAYVDHLVARPQTCMSCRSTSSGMGESDRQTGAEIGTWSKT